MSAIRHGLAFSPGSRRRSGRRERTRGPDARSAVEETVRERLRALADLPKATAVERRRRISGRPAGAMGPGNGRSPGVTRASVGVVEWR
jgi:hypothetical protein